MVEKDLDIELFNKIKSGSEDAMEVIFRKYYSRLCLFVQTYVNDSYLSEDIVTELFTNIWIKKDKIEISISLKSYLYTSARNAALMYIRKKKLQTENIDNHQHVVFESGELPCESMDKEQKEQNINTIMEKIPPRCRQVFILHRFEEMKYREISEYLHISIKTVENHISKALKILHENKELVKKLLTLMLFIMSVL